MGQRNRAFGDGRVAFVAKLGVDAAVCAAAAGAIIFAVWWQDPEVRAAAAPPAPRVPVPAWYASARGLDAPVMPPVRWQVARRGSRTFAPRTQADSF